MYDGVRTHGLVHQLRMESVFWGRQRVLLKLVEVFLAALPPVNQERAELVMRAWRDLEEVIYVGQRESREEHDRRRMAILQREVGRKIEVTPQGDV